MNSLHLAPSSTTSSTPKLDAVNALKPDSAEARQRWRAFWAGEVLERPCISIVAPRDGAAEMPAPIYMEGHDGNFDEPLARLQAFIESRFWGGEAMPRYVPSFGPDMFAGFLGARLEYAPETGTSWAVPFVEKWEEVLPLRLNMENELLTRLRAFMQRIAKAAAGRWLVANIDMHSNMDALAAIRNPERICLDLLDQPELIERAMRDVRALYAPISDLLYADGNMAATGATGWIGMYHENKFSVLQCDFACLVSNELFRRFILPALEEETEYQDHSIYHLDGPGALRHLDDLLALPKLDAIQWVPGAGEKPLREWLEVLRKILAAGKGVQIYCAPGEIEYFHRALGPKRVWYDCGAKSEAEARKALKWLAKNT